MEKSNEIKNPFAELKNQLQKKLDDGISDDKKTEIENLIRELNEAENKNLENDFLTEAGINSVFITSFSLLPIFLACESNAAKFFSVVLVFLTTFSFISAIENLKIRKIFLQHFEEYFAEIKKVKNSVDKILSKKKSQNEKFFGNILVIKIREFVKKINEISLNSGVLLFKTEKINFPKYKIWCDENCEISDGNEKIIIKKKGNNFLIFKKNGKKNSIETMNEKNKKEILQILDDAQKAKFEKFLAGN